MLVISWFSHFLIEVVDSLARCPLQPTLPPSWSRWRLKPTATPQLLLTSFACGSFGDASSKRMSCCQATRQWFMLSSVLSELCSFAFLVVFILCQVYKQLTVSSSSFCLFLYKVLMICKQFPEIIDISHSVFINQPWYNFLFNQYYSFNRNTL